MISINAVRAFPEQTEFYINLGNSYMLEKDTLNGIKYFEQGLELEPSNTALRKQIVEFLKAAGFEEKAMALEKKK